jgi:membrane protein YdbS with pleckstrin-like domain
VSGVDGVFAPPSEAWVRVSPKLITARRLVLVIMVVPLVLVLVGVTLAVAPTWVPALIGGTGLVVLVWVWWLIGRRVRSYGYCERDDDLLVTSGILFRRLVIVPYGRMQLVDVSAGPIDRTLGITTVQLHTAAATSDAAIPGLPPDEASALRDRLSAVGEQRSAGL